jgi:hypothetical protein
MGDAKTIEPL